MNLFALIISDEEIFTFYNSEQFLDQLQRIDIKTNQIDCPNQTLRAIYNKLKVVLPSSYLYVFTDATKNDLQFEHSTIAEIQRNAATVSN